MTSGDAKGFTMIELLVVAVLGALIILATYQVLSTNERAFTAQRAQIRGQRTVRTGLELLTAELREISPSGGDIIRWTPDSMTIRKATAFGITCGVNGTSAPPTVTVARTGRWFNATDSIVVLAENDPRTSADDAWLMGIPSSVDTTATCGSRVAQTLSLAGMAMALTSNTVRVGAPVRAFRHETYGSYWWGSQRHLARRVGGGTVEPLVGPLRWDSLPGLRLEYLDQMGDSTSVLTDVAQIRITLRTRSDVRGPSGQFLADSITASVFPRN